jgi:mono/diheme cytochrome c family protein
MIKLIIWVSLLLFCICSLLPTSAKKTSRKPIDGKAVFEQHCASCHAGGANRVNPHRPIAGSSKLSTIAVFKSYLSAPPGHMPYYEDVVKDKETLKALYHYCQTLKATPRSEAAINRSPSLADFDSARTRKVARTG